ncbi:hypothetical protein [Nocardioides caricicola]|uniref:Uncharacterized protein n=1 Tax=Nocardioides caricicola TaxID=634770 RepID=A0ABW0MV44_9ACTN
MKFTQRLGDGARAVNRATRSLGRDLVGGPEAVYARVLDGEHLWVAVDAATGRPALRDPASGEIVEATALPGEDPAYASARWRLDDVLPPAEDAELQLVALTGDGAKPTRLRPAPPHPEGNLRVPPTPDGRWRFLVEPDARGLLRVRRSSAAHVARLTHISVDGDAVRVVVSPPVAGLEPRLHFVAKDDLVAHSVPAETAGGEIVAHVRVTDLPATAGGYRVAVGPLTEPVTVVRLRNDIHITEPANVLLPHLLDPETEAIAGRFLYTTQGVLRLMRKDAETVS